MVFGILKFRCLVGIVEEQEPIRLQRLQEAETLPKPHANFSFYYLGFSEEKVSSPPSSLEGTSDIYSEPALDLFSACTVTLNKPVCVWGRGVGVVSVHCFFSSLPEVCGDGGGFPVGSCS